MEGKRYLNELKQVILARPCKLWRSGNSIHRQRFMPGAQWPPAANAMEESRCLPHNLLLQTEGKNRPTSFIESSHCRHGNVVSLYEHDVVTGALMRWKGLHVRIVAGRILWRLQQLWYLKEVELGTQWNSGWKLFSFTLENSVNIFFTSKIISAVFFFFKFFTLLTLFICIVGVWRHLVAYFPYVLLSV